MSTKVRINLLGTGNFYVNGQLANFDGPKAKELAIFIVAKKAVTRGEIFDVFWPDFTVKQAQNAFHALKRKVSLSLLNTQLFEFDEIFYSISNDNSVKSDLDFFTQAIQAENWKQAVRCYCGDFFPDSNSEWVVQLRKSLKAEYEYALFALAIKFHQEKRYKKAQQYYEEILAVNPLREDVALYLTELPTFTRLEAQEILRQVIVNIKQMGFPPDQRTVGVFEKMLQKK